MSLDCFRTAAVIGTGMMGPGIAVTLALGGVRSTIVSRREESAAKGLAAARAHLKLLEANGLAAPGKAAVIDCSTAFDATLAAVDLAIESAPEDLELKQKLFARMDSLARPDAVLASNTSGLRITAVAALCKHPERVLTTHFWNPPHLMPLVEIVKGERTGDEAVQSVRELLGACGKVPVLVKQDRPGQLGNRLQMALAREAAHIVAEGIADAEDVDTAVRNGFGLRLPAYGVLEHMDTIGLDLARAVVDYVSADLYNGAAAPPVFGEKLARGELGMKSGTGFYDWSKKDASEVRARRDGWILDVMKKRREGRR